MKFAEEKKTIIVHYILEKINQKQPSLSRHVAEAFSISPNTVHTYLNELLQDGIIEKSGRDTYALVTREQSFYFHRSMGEIKDETKILDATLLPFIKPFSSAVQGIWSYAFSEMVNNVIDHSGAETLCVLIRQNAYQTSVSIMDDGVGIFENIQKHFGYDSLEDAIVELSKGKLTTDEEHHSGEGIFFTSRMMDEFFILSDGKLFSVNKYEEESLDTVASSFPFSTDVHLILANQSKKCARDIFDQYANDADGFTKTRLPMSRIFESSPISRSQAKRVANRLDRFTDVELDFEGVEFMGQGFAHELFVVFAKSHPEIHLIPLHMEDAVAKMYRHVTA